MRRNYIGIDGYCLEEPKELSKVKITLLSYNNENRTDFFTFVNLNRGFKL